MGSLTDSFDEGIPMPVVPRPDLAELMAELAARDYSYFDRQCIESYARALGTLEGCAQVDPEDRAALDEVLERAWPEVPADSDRWDADTWRGAPSRWTIAGGLVPPDIDAGPYEPTEEDWGDYCEWSRGLDPITLETEPFHP